MIKKLAIISTHPIQYNVPLFQLLHARNKIEIKVFYTWGEDVMNDKFDPGFNDIIEWDLPLLTGYNSEFCNNISKEKGSHHFNGIKNPDLIGKVNAYNPDALLVFGWSFNSHLKALRYFKGKVPVLFRGDSTLLDFSSFLKKKFRNLFLKWVYRHIDLALFTGKNNYDYFISAGLKYNQLVFAPHSIDNNRFGNLPSEMKEFSSKLKLDMGVHSTDLVLLFAGKFENKKDVLFLIEGFKKASLLKNIHLVIAGSGVLEDKIKISIKDFYNIHLIGFVNQYNMPAVYEMADVFILPSRGPGETWGLSVNEAMANGKAIIVSDKCGCAADLIQGNGFVFESGNREDLIAKLQFITTSRQNLEQMKLNSKKIIENYSLDRLASVIESAVLNV